jgi:DNA-binding response OmpR family regulator
MFTTTLENGVIKYTDSPLLRAIAFGRIIIIDEADKAPEHVVAIFRSLAGQSELSLSDGRRVRATRERSTDIVVHRNFRLVLLANRPGYRALLCFEYYDTVLTDIMLQRSSGTTSCRSWGRRSARTR